MRSTNFKLTHMPKTPDSKLNEAFLDAAYSTYHLINLSKRAKTSYR